MSAISIIIPTLNEATRLPAALSRTGSPATREVIVADGGSSDATREIAHSAGCVVIDCPAGRARQQNRGAALARGTILLFLHADTMLPRGFERTILAIMAEPTVAAGAFALAIHPPSPGKRLIAGGANLRSRLLQLPYGDQALFLERKRFLEIGGFPELPIMEDFVLVRNLRRSGRIVTAGEAVQTSARRWEHLGIIRTTLINQAVVLGYYLGIDPGRLAAWYRNQRRRRR